MGPYLWWGKIALVALAAMAVLLYGIETLAGAFQLKNPLEFIMLFFSASLVILVSLVGLLYCLLQSRARLRDEQKGSPDGH